MNEPLLWDYIGEILLAMLISWGIGMFFGLLAGHAWGSARTSGEMGDREKRLAQELLRLKEQLKYNLSID